MHLRKKIFSLLIALFLCVTSCVLVACPAPANDPSPPVNAAGAALRSTVAVLAEDRDESGNLLSMADATGIVYSTNDRGGAYIMTNYHVIAGQNGTPSSHISVSPYGYDFDSGHVTAEIVGALRDYDLALLYAEGLSALSSSLSAVSFSEEPPRTGASLILTGNALGRGIGVFSGLLSMESEYVTYDFSYTDGPSTLREMRIDAAFYEGCSGGGVFDGEGLFCGLVNSRLAFEGNAHIGYAIPSSILAPLCQAWVRAHEAGQSPPMLYTLRWGVTYKTAVKDVAWNGTAPIPQTTLSVAALTPGSLGSLFLQTGDVITALTVNGTDYRVGDAYHMTESCFGILPGDSVTVHYTRAGENGTYSFTVHEAYLTPLA